ncbi:Thiamin-phosphate pyrophosphorylase [Methylophaga frappieri]|uniref:Thiamine-phosphate synthase n=1 Tax=Methylophaga frappieri (strain ATCC BAA-2434 / DSM 25690 / JAM7) TaxID=754477 RepID=I1YEH3_METFJ|nr:thiamine phosphate synthase [Methylophaga frappieri]AFJ01316.1 Thiamin-phosphate pyrophosphorylase [Methylophaga frappieri]
MVKPVVLLIGGIDPQGAAGLTVDIQTVTQLGGHPVSLVTCLTEQTAQGLTRLNPLGTAEFKAQLACCCSDFELAAIKIGLLPNSAIAEIVAEFIKTQTVPVVLDPVLSISHGGEVDSAIAVLIKAHFLPHLTLLTPNLPELQQLAGDGEPSQQIDILIQQGLSACLVKGGHDSGAFSTDFYKDAFSQFSLGLPRLPYPMRGTGCRLATAIATQLAFGHRCQDAIVLARSYVAEAYQQASSVGPYRLLGNFSWQLNRQSLPAVHDQTKPVEQSWSFARCPEQLGVYAVVDSADWVRRCLQSGIRTVQLRIKEAEQSHITREIQQAIHEAAAFQDSRLFINDHWQLAIQYGAYGVHLGQEDLQQADLEAIARAGLRLGISTHSHWELARALAVQPSYIALGPVYPTTSKQMPWQPQGLHTVREWLRILENTIPLVAIGGITVPRAVMLHELGVKSVAMISAITRSADTQQVIRALLALWPETETEKTKQQSSQKISVN